MAGRLEGKAAIITGAANGQGRVAAEMQDRKVMDLPISSEEL